MSPPLIALVVSSFIYMDGAFNALPLLPSRLRISNFTSAAVSPANLVDNILEPVRR